MSIAALTKNIDLKTHFATRTLEDDLTILEKESTLDQFLSLTYNLCKSKGDLRAPVAKFELPEEQYSLVSKILDYACSLAETYEDKALDLFSSSLDSLVFLSEEKREEYISTLRGFVKKESESPNKSHILPALINEVLVPLNQKYRVRLKDIQEMNGQREMILNELDRDIKKFMTYANAKISQNERFDQRAFEINYSECFPEKAKINYAGLDAKYITELIGTGSIEELIKKYGTPIGMQIKGIREARSNSVVLIFGDEKGQLRLPMDYPKGLSQGEVSFYLSLCNRARPIDSLVSETGKCKKFLESYKF